MSTRIPAALILSLRFLVAVVISGFQTLRIVLFQRAAPNAGFIRMKFAPMTDTGASLLGCLITLTPGTTTIDVDMDQRILTLHLLDTSDAAGAVAGIRRDFEAYIIVLCGTEAAP